MQIKRQDRIVFLRSLLANFASVRVEGAANLPASGGAVIVCNHTDLSDGLIQLLYTPRPLVFLAKSELFESGGNLRISDIIEGNEFFRQFPSDILADMMSLAGQFIQDVDAMPVIRGYRGVHRRDAAAYYRELAESVVKRLTAGELVAIYPEGRRSTSGELLPFKGFAARMALLARVRVIPCCIQGNTGLASPRLMEKNSPRSVIYKIGQSILPEEFPEGGGKYAVKRLTQKIEARVKELSG